MFRPFILIVAAVFIFGCDDNVRQKQQEQTTDTADNIVNQPNATGHEFVIIANGREIPLTVWEYDVNLDSILGKPKSAKIQVPGEGADTHTGASIKTLTYPGL